MSNRIFQLGIFVNMVGQTKRQSMKMLSGKTAAVFAPMSILLSLLLVLYFEVLKGLVADWWIDPNYSHGFLIPLISGYLVWERKEALAELKAVPCNWGLLLIIFGLCALVVGTAGAEFFTMRFSFILVLAGLILFSLGKDFFMVLFFPLAFLIFMVPLPYLIYDSIAFPLKLFAAKVATHSLQLLDVPILREGNIIILPSTTLEVADACSGIRSLISLISLAVVYAYFSQKVFWGRAVVVAFSLPIAIAANSLRIVITGLLAHYVSAELAEGFFHEFSGWLVFVVAFMMLFALGTLVSRISEKG